MTKNSHSQFRPNSESQVLGSIDPLLIISEPPDIKNWFSSYEYQSPELNTADGLECCNTFIGYNSEEEEEEEVSYVEDSINVKDEDLGVFLEQTFSESDDWRSSGEVERNGFSEEGSYVEDSFKEKDEILGVFEDLGGGVELKTKECDEVDTCVEDSIKWNDENLGVIGDLDTTDFVGCGGHKGDDCSREDSYVEDSIKQKVEKSGVFGEHGKDETFVHDQVKSIGNDVTNQVADMSDTLNFSSEPPDIKNWFSSYVYESPALDTSDGDEFRLSSYEESKTARAGKEENGMETKITLKSDDLVGRKMASTGFVRTSSSVEHNSHDHEKWGNQETSGKRNISAAKDLPLKGISHQISESNSAPDREAVSINDVELSDLKERDSTRKPKRKFPQNDPHKAFGTLRRLGNEENSPRKSLNKRDFVQKDSEGRAQADSDMIVSPKSNLDFIASRRSSSRTDMSNDKENGKNDCAESGFVSARKKRSLGENDENSPIRLPEARAQSLRSGVKVSSVGNKDDNSNRRPLTDTTNTQPSDVLGVAGKWRCPQKSKPNLGPPMKQLRLERWVHRL